MSKEKASNTLEEIPMVHRKKSGSGRSSSSGLVRNGTVRLRAVAALCRSCRLCLVVAVLLVVTSTQAFGYGGDTHYYLHFGIALEACFDWDEAHLIASANYLVDKNRTTTSEKHPFSRQCKIAWHAFGGSEERFNALWERVLAEKDRGIQLVKLGQFLHFVSDWEAHHGFSTRWGHGFDTLTGRDPDSLASDRSNNHRMIVQSLFHMLKVCEAREQAPAQQTERSLGRLMMTKSGPFVFDPRIEELFVSGSPNWRALGRGKKGRKLLADSHRIVEELIEVRDEMRPERKIPEEFTPGDPEKGVPPPIGLRYDENGDLVEVVGVEFELLPEYEGDVMSDEKEEAVEEALDSELVNELALKIQGEEDPSLDVHVWLEMLDADLEEDGWTIEVRVENFGDRASSDGELELWVSHLVTEELLGEAKEQIPGVAGEGAVRRRVFVAADTEPTKEVMITGVLNMDDLSADDNDDWFLPWGSGFEATTAKGKKKRKAWTPAPATILGEPLLWDLDAQGVWMSLALAAPGGDTTRRIEQTSMVLIGPGERFPVNLNEGRPVIWFAAPDVKRRIVTARTFSWIPYNDVLCGPMARPDFRPQHLELTVSGVNIEPTSMRIELEDRVVKEMRHGCASRQPDPDL